MQQKQCGFFMNIQILLLNKLLYHLDYQSLDKRQNLLQYHLHQELRQKLQHFQ